MTMDIKATKRTYLSYLSMNDFDTKTLCSGLSSFLWPLPLEQNSILNSFDWSLLSMLENLNGRCDSPTSV